MAEDHQSKYPIENDTEYGSPPPYSDQDTHPLTAPAAAPQPAITQLKLIDIIQAVPGAGKH